MKRAAVLLAVFISLVFLCSCAHEPSPLPTSAVPTSEPSFPVTTDEPVVTPAAESPVPTSLPSPAPSVQPTPEMLPEPDRPTDGELAVYYAGNSHTVSAELVRGALFENTGLCFSLYSDTATYEYIHDNNAYRFTPIPEKGSQPDDLTFMEFLFIDGATCVSLAPAFMDLYLDYDEIEFSTSKTIGVSKLRCDVVVAYNTDQYITAYLYECSGGVAAFVISSSTDANDYHRARFSAMLDTVALFEYTR